MNNLLYFLNENYDWMPEIFSLEDDLGPEISQGLHFSVDRPLSYQAQDLPSSCAKSFYDLDGLIVSQNIAEIFESLNDIRIKIIPITILFKDMISLPYYRVDTTLEVDVIDYSLSTIIDGNLNDGYEFEKIVLSKDKILENSTDNLKFFRLKGIDEIQYMISSDIKAMFDDIYHHAIISDETCYIGI